MNYKIVRKEHIPLIDKYKLEELLVKNIKLYKPENHSEIEKQKYIVSLNKACNEVVVRVKLGELPKLDETATNYLHSILLAIEGNNLVQDHIKKTINRYLNSYVGLVNEIDRTNHISLNTLFGLN